VEPASTVFHRGTSPLKPPKGAEVLCGDRNRLAVENDRAGTAGRQTFRRNLNLDQHLDMDTKKLRQELGYVETLPRCEALQESVAWDREHPPSDIDPAQFNYAAEDAILNRARRTRPQ
jgi:hypothetical protein